MPILIALGAGAGAAWLIGKAIDKAGEGVNDAGTGAIKFAVAGAIGAGAVIMLKRAGMV